jgi:hypothetical protein
MGEAPGRRKFFVRTPVARECIDIVSDTKIVNRLLSSKFEQAAAQYAIQDGGGAGGRDAAARTLSYQQIGSYEVTFVEGCVQVDEQ